VIFVCDYFHVDFVIGIFFDKLSVMQNGFLSKGCSQKPNISVASIFESSTVLIVRFTMSYPALISSDVRYNGVTIRGHRFK
jgi:hypothetical protein